MAEKCDNCKKKEEVESISNIEYSDSELSLVVSPKSTKSSKDTFNELFEKMKKSQSKRNNK